jgi:hypothetical protein
MKSLSLKSALLLFFGFVLSYVFFGLYLVKLPVFQAHPDKFSMAITLDLCLGLPFLFYFFIVKKRQWDVLLTVIALVPAIGLASYILPKENHFYVNLAMQSLVFTEGGLMLYAILKIRKIIGFYRQYAQKSNDFIENIENSLGEILGKSSLATTLLASEISMLYYGLFFWRIKPQYGLGIENEDKTPSISYFTVHKKVGYGAILAVLSMGGILEILGMHYFIAQYSEIGALMLTILSIYSVIFIVADFVAMIKRPIIFENNLLKFRVGLRWSADIPVSEIIDCQLIKNFKKDKIILSAAILGSPNCLIVLKNPITVKGIYGIRRTVPRIAFNVDNEQAFLAATMHK